MGGDAFCDRWDPLPLSPRLKQIPVPLPEHVRGHEDMRASRASWENDFMDDGTAECGVFLSWLLQGPAVSQCSLADVFLEISELLRASAVPDSDATLSQLGDK